MGLRLNNRRGFDLELSFHNMTKKEQAIVEQLNTIPEFAGLYELFQEKLRIEDLSKRCKELRYVLERIITIACRIAGFSIDKVKITLKLDALKEHIPSELLDDRIKDAFAQANTYTRKYMHDREVPEPDEVIQKRLRTRNNVPLPPF